MTEKSDIKKMTPNQQLAIVNEAINAVLVGGQSYTIGSRSLTRADLRQLKQMKEELEAEINSQNAASGLIENTYVAVFDRR